MTSRQFFTCSYPTHFLTPEYNKEINYFKLIIQKISYKQKIIWRKKFQEPDRIFSFKYRNTKYIKMFSQSIRFGALYITKSNNEFRPLTFIKIDTSVYLFNKEGYKLKPK